MSRPADGVTLEQIVGELQSEWGVPQSPQEYRITLKVADERARAGGPAAVLEERSDPEDPEELVTGTPVADATATVRREKAPAAPRVAVSEGPVEEEGAEKPRKRRRRRRRGRGKSR